MKIKTVCVFYFSILALVPSAFAGKTELTTYYPSAYGEYINLKSTADSYFATTSGNVGIGTTSAISKLDVLGTLSVGNQTTAGGIGKVQITTDGASPINNRLTFGTDGTGWKFAIGKNQGGTVTEYMTFQDNGNVGIGTTTSSARLQVTNAAGSTSNSYLTTNDFVLGTIGSALLVDFGATSGNTYTKLAGLSGGASAWNNLVLQSGGGYVGIGTTAPSGKLHVAGDIWGSSADLANRYFWQRGAGADVWVRLYTAAAAYQSLAVGPFFANGAVRFDLAEVTPVRSEEDLEPGDVVCIDKEAKVGLRRSQTAYDPLVAGIVSDPNTVSMMIGGDTPPEKIGTIKDKKPIALVGRVLCKVSMENGPIEAGDLLVTSSNAGHAMKADLNKLKPGMAVGKAMEPSSVESTKIMVWVTHG